jgi:hypothetical protein
VTLLTWEVFFFSKIRMILLASKPCFHYALSVAEDGKRHINRWKEPKGGDGGGTKPQLMICFRTQNRDGGIDRGKEEGSLFVSEVGERESPERPFGHLDSHRAFSERK